MSTPLRFVLRYDPVFLELGKRLGNDEWGKLTGVSVSAVLSRAEDERELFAFLITLFGLPSTAVRTDFPAFSRSIFLYGDSALIAECVVSPDAPLYGRAAAVSGLLSCSQGCMEFRLGSERILTAARDESHVFHLSMAEGDGERYRSMDEADPRGPVVVSPLSDAAAVAAAGRLLSGGVLP